MVLHRIGHSGHSDHSAESDERVMAILAQAASAARDVPSASPLNRYLRPLVLDYAGELARRAAWPYEDEAAVLVDILWQLLGDAEAFALTGEVAFLRALLAEVTAAPAA